MKTPSSSGASADYFRYAGCGVVCRCYRHDDGQRYARAPVLINFCTHIPGGACGAQSCDHLVTHCGERGLDAAAPIRLCRSIYGAVKTCFARDAPIAGEKSQIERKHPTYPIISGLALCRDSDRHQ